MLFLLILKVLELKADIKTKVLALQLQLKRSILQKVLFFILGHMNMIFFVTTLKLLMIHSPKMPNLFNSVI